MQHLALHNILLCASLYIPLLENLEIPVAEMTQRQDLWLHAHMLRMCSFGRTSPLWAPGQARRTWHASLLGTSRSIGGLPACTRQVKTGFSLLPTVPPRAAAQSVQLTCAARAVPLLCGHLGKPSTLSMHHRWALSAQQVPFSNPRVIAARRTRSMIP